MQEFRNGFIQSLADSIQSIAIQTLDPGSWADLESLSDYAERGLPLLILDTRDRSAFEEKVEAEENITVASFAALVKDEVTATQKMLLNCPLAAPDHYSACQVCLVCLV